MNKLKFNKYWFKPKRFGYGAAPSTWEGWLTIAIFIIYVLFLSGIYSIEEHTTSYFLYVFAGVIILIIISRIKTEGKWRWSWGKKR